MGSSQELDPSENAMAFQVLGEKELNEARDVVNASEKYGAYLLDLAAWRAWEEYKGFLAKLGEEPPQVVEVDYTEKIAKARDKCK